MPLSHIILLALVQGLTEFLPVSSSGHLILAPKLFKFADQGLEMDVAMHVGTLGAVLVYFRKDVWRIMKGLLALIRGRVDGGGRLALYLVLATIPAVVFGATLSAFGTNGMRTIIFVGWTTLGFGLLMFVADKVGALTKKMGDMTAFQAFLVGLAQAAALLPGTSRSGACMTMARFLGYERKEAARFAFLLSIPAILAAASHTALKVYLKGSHFTLYSEAFYAMVFSFIVGLGAISFMMRWLTKSDLTPFVIYRIALGTLLLSWGYGWLKF
ncbi:MAG: undecaprenyl-diphosphate phosphatase [Candidatus Puniceispirillum sp.]|nr:undecaprenyl-diphosphate phosphatase [Candidatus Puniceispirillum sp.]